jgi:NTP pyrophosphatase (non-canonical NTP hydrolase)
MGRLNDLVTESFKIATEKGWHKTERSLSAITLLMQSEVSEVIEEYRKNKGITEVWYEAHYEENGVSYTTIGGPGDKPCGIPVEIADLVIRIADYCGKRGYDMESIYSNVPEPKPIEEFEEWLARINYSLSQAWAGIIPSREFWLAMAIKYAFGMAKNFGIPLWATIDEKTAFNRTRPERYGGKKI